VRHRRSKRLVSSAALLAVVGLCWTATGTAWAGTIDTSFLEQVWPREHVRELEVGRHPVRWRHYAPRDDGIFVGVSFRAPTDVPTTWNLTTDYRDVGAAVPGVVRVEYLEQSETRDVIRIEIMVLWKRLSLMFEVERDAPHVTRFRLTHEIVGEYRGVCRFRPAAAENAGAAASGGTEVEFATWLQPSRPVPRRLMVLVQRMALLPAVREFLDACEQHLGTGGDRAST